MVAPKIEYWDTGRVAREKINAIIDYVEASIPSIGENGHRYIGEVDTGIVAAGFGIRENNNLIKKVNDEIFTDLQFGENLTTTSAFPLGVTVGNVSSLNWRPKNGILLNAKTPTSYCRWLYGNDNKLYFDGGLWVFKVIATTDNIQDAITQLRNDLHTVAFTGKSSDLDNDANFSVVEAEYEEVNENT